MVVQHHQLDLDLVMFLILVQLQVNLVIVKMMHRIHNIHMDQLTRAAYAAEQMILVR